MNLLKTLLLTSLASFALAVQADTILIRGASVHTMDKNGTLENTDVFIEDGKIKPKIQYIL